MQTTPHPLRLWLMSQDMTIRAFSRKCGIADTYLSDIMGKGRNITMRHAIAIRDATHGDITLDMLAAHIRHKDRDDT